MADFIVEMRAIDSLRPNPRNYNRHSPEQIAALGRSLQVHGQEKNVSIAGDGMILTGHGLVDAARSIGWSHIACKVYQGPAPDAWMVADNYLATLAAPDPEALTTLLQSLQDVGQLDYAGYDDEGLGKLIAELEAATPKAVAEEGAIPEVQDGPTRVQPGDVWQLGKHRVMCGDSTDARAVAALMGGACLIYASPRPLTPTCANMG